MCVEGNEQRRSCLCEDTALLWYFSRMLRNVTQNLSEKPDARLIFKLGTCRLCRRKSKHITITFGHDSVMYT